MLENVDAHISEVLEREPCEHCSKKFKNEVALEKHIDVAHLQKCEQCDEEYYSDDSLQAHVMDIHESEECDISNTKFLMRTR